MPRDFAALSRPPIPSSTQAWPWTWSGWPEKFAAAGYQIQETPRLHVTGPQGTFYFLTAAEVRQAYTQLRTDLKNWQKTSSPGTFGKTHWDYLDPQLKTADGLWVDFFPDELSGWSWDQIRDMAGKMFFLPPLVKVPTAVSKTLHQQSLISDEHFAGFSLPEPEPISTNAAGLFYDPQPLPPAYLDKLFNFTAIKRLEDLSQILNSPGWVLQCQDPQAEQALYALAQTHGVKIAFWERAYSSPLRYLAGYESPFDECGDKNLRARLKRVRASFVLPKPLAAQMNISEVTAKLGYARLGLAGERLDFSFNTPGPTPAHTSAQKIVTHLKDSITLPALPIAIEQLSKLNPSAEKEALNGRVWKAFIMRILSASPAQARRSWYYSFCRYPQQTLGTTVTLLNIAQELKSPTLTTMKLLLQTVLYYKIEPAQVKMLFDYLKKTESRWLTHSNDAWGWEIKALLHVAEGGDPQTAVPDDYRDSKIITDLWAIHGILALRAGRRSEGIAALRKELGKGTLSDFGQIFALKHLFDEADEFFGEFLEHTSRAENVSPVAAACNEFSAAYVGDPAWRQKYHPIFTSLIKALDKRASNDGLGGILQLCFRATVGDAQTLSDYHAHLPKYGRETGAFLATLYFVMRDNASAAQALDLAGSQFTSDYFVALTGVLNHILGRRDNAWELFTQLKELNPYFWQSSFISPRQDMIAFMLGLLGKTSGDEELTALALRQMDIPAWEDHRVGVQNAPRQTGVEKLEQNLRQWILSKPS